MPLAKLIWKLQQTMYVGLFQSTNSTSEITQQDTNAKGWSQNNTMNKKFGKDVFEDILF